MFERGKGASPIAAKPLEASCEAASIIYITVAAPLVHSYIKCIIDKLIVCKYCYLSYQTKIPFIYIGIMFMKIMSDI